MKRAEVAGGRKLLVQELAPPPPGASSCARTTFAIAPSSSGRSTRVAALRDRLSAHGITSVTVGVVSVGTVTVFSPRLESSPPFFSCPFFLPRPCPHRSPRWWSAGAGSWIVFTRFLVRTRLEILLELLRHLTVVDRGDRRFEQLVGTACRRADVTGVDVRDRVTTGGELGDCARECRSRRCGRLRRPLATAATARSEYEGHEQDRLRTLGQSSSFSVGEASCERLRQPGLPHLVLRSLDWACDGGTRQTSARSRAEARRRGSPSRGCLTEPGFRSARLVEAPLRPGRREPARDEAAVECERQRDAVADEHQRRRREQERCEGGLVTEHVVPDGIPGLAWNSCACSSPHSAPAPSR